MENKYTMKIYNLGATEDRTERNKTKLYEGYQGILWKIKSMPLLSKSYGTNISPTLQRNIESS